MLTWMLLVKFVHPGYGSYRPGEGIEREDRFRVGPLIVGWVGVVGDVLLFSVSLCLWISFCLSSNLLSLSLPFCLRTD